MKKFIKSRKFWIIVAVLVLIWTGYYYTVNTLDLSGANIVMLFTVCTGTTTLFCIAGIGGYIWKDWIKSAYYAKELDDRVNGVQT